MPLHNVAPWPNVSPLGHVVTDARLVQLTNPYTFDQILIGHERTELGILLKVEGAAREEDPHIGVLARLIKLPSGYEAEGIELVDTQDRRTVTSEFARVIVGESGNPRLVPIA